MVGKGGGSIRGGRVLDYRDQPERQMCRLYMSMMNKMGVSVPSFGDAKQPLHELES